MFVTRFEDIHKDDIPTAGGKGANLGELTRLGQPVPPGFVVTTEGYRHFVAANDLQTQIVTLAAVPQADNPESFETASTQIQALFLANTIPDDLADAIRSAYGELAAHSALAVAVRSSATAEDLPSASFAGQQDTYLNIRGVDALLDAVKRCWASLWTARAIAYRARQGIEPAVVSLAAIVQQMVDADAAGILFTANPADGRRDQVNIDAGWGLGEAVVGGLVTPDQWVVDKASGQVISRQIADKSTMTVYTEAGTIEQAVPEAKRQQPAIDEAVAVALAQLGTQIEEHYGMPMDIEWAVAGDELAILQARPITALPEPAADPPTEWPIPVEGSMYVRGSITEQLPDPLSPLFATLATPQMTKSILNLFLEVLGTDGSRFMGFTVINGYVYIYMVLGREMLQIYWNGMGAFPSLFRNGTTRWRDDFRPRYVETIARWQATPREELAAADLLTGARELTYRGTELYTGVQLVIPLAMISEGSFTQLYDRLVKRPDDPPAQTMLLGYDSQPIRADKSLYDLAAWCGEAPTLAEFLMETPAEHTLALLHMTVAPSGIGDELWQEWRTRFQRHLDQFGHAIYNLDFINSVAADDPALLFETFKFYLAGQGANPYKRQQEIAARREETAQRLLARLDPLRGPLFQKLLTWAQRVTPVREDALADVGLGWPLLRQLLLELGRRLSDAGAIAQAEDIFWLEEAEVAEMAVALDAGQKRFDSYDDTIVGRKMLWRGQKRVTPPQVLPEKLPWWLSFYDGLMPAGSADQSGPVIRGVPVGAGTVTAPARVIAGPEDFGQMQPGEVLVAGITTPAWTPLFALAAGVVTDVGGPMSHGGIVAREYGIPAVLGTGIATKRIRSGQTVLVDGDAGTVTLLDEVDTKMRLETSVKETPDEQIGSRTKKVVFVALGVGLLIGTVLWRRRRRRR